MLNKKMDVQIYVVQYMMYININISKHMNTETQR